MRKSFEFSICPDRVCIAKLPLNTDFSALHPTPGFFSITRTGEELSVVADESFAFPGAEVQRGWRGIRVKGPLEFDLSGVLASFLRLLDQANVGVYALSIYSTDYFFVLDNQVDRVIQILEGAGHRRSRERKLVLN